MTEHGLQPFGPVGATNIQHGPKGAVTVSRRTGPRSLQDPWTDQTEGPLRALLNADGCEPIADDVKAAAWDRGRRVDLTKTGVLPGWKLERSSVTVETLKDWARCSASPGDPERAYHRGVTGPEPMDVVEDVAREVAAAGGRAYIVGGWVRDRLLGRDNKDIDVEVFGLAPDALKTLLERRGRVDTVGASFGVFRVAGLDVDFSLPRRDRNLGPGHTAFEVTADPSMTVADAARRRDFTINALSFDPLTEDVIDPTSGEADLRAGILRAVDPATFGDDPLRAVRAAQFAARFELSVAPELFPILAAQDLSELPGERMFEEFRKLLLRGVRPSLGLHLLRDAGLLHHFPQIDALRDVPQDPQWHPEGDVYVHTTMALDVAATLRTGDDDEDLVFLFGVLCHDFGKPETTKWIDGRLTSRGHEPAGEGPTRRFLQRMRAPRRLEERVVVLVREHLAPMLLGTAKAGPAAYRRLARRTMPKGVSLELLERTARADSWGRTTPDALARRFDHGDRLLAMSTQLAVPKSGPRDVVQGRHLITRGFQPGKSFSAILGACREYQDDTGATDPDVILGAVLPTLGAS